MRAEGKQLAQAQCALGTGSPLAQARSALGTDRPEGRQLAQAQCALMTNSSFAPSLSKRAVSHQRALSPLDTGKPAPGRFAARSQTLRMLDSSMSVGR